MLVAKNPDYKGPKTYNKIVKELNREGRERKQYISYYKLRKVLGLYFGQHHGIGKFIARGKTFYVKPLGLIKYTSRHSELLKIRNMKRKVKVNQDKYYWKLIHINGLSVEEAKNKVNKSKKYRGIPHR